MPFVCGTSFATCLQPTTKNSDAAFTLKNCVLHVLRVSAVGFLFVVMFCMFHAGRLETHEL